MLRAAAVVAFSGCIALFGLVFARAVPPAAGKDAKATAYVGARIHTAAGTPIDNGVLVIRDGKIAAVGPRDKIVIPDGATIRDLSGKVIIPGLVDTHSHIGVFSRPSVSANQDGNESTGPVQPGLRAIDAVNPDDPGFRMALAGGVTVSFTSL